MKPTNVSIEYLELDPREIPGFIGDEAYACEVTAFFPGGGQVSRTTSAYNSKKIACSEAESIRDRLMALDWEAA
jgi:hypothetical protein